MDSIGMFEIRYVERADKSFWFTLDEHMSEAEFGSKLRDRRGYIICNGNEPVGVLRYNLFWDNIPFLTLIYLKMEYRRKRFGEKSLLSWENEMRELGYKVVMTSTQADEQAQHFFRKLGYIEKGSLSFDNTPLEQPLEMFMLKSL